MIKLVYAAILFLLSLMVIFRAPVYFLWLADVAITSFPFIFIGLSLIGFVSGLWVSKYQGLVLILSFSSLIFFTLPLFVSLWGASTIYTEMKKVFPSKCGESSISLTRMFSRAPNDKFETMVYKQTPELTLDFYRSISSEPSPLILVIHGGSWQSGDSRQLAELNTYLSWKGYHVAAINYRLAPEYKSPAPVEDTRQAIDFLKKNAGKLNIDTTSIVILGRSAGAQIGLTAAYSQSIPGVKGVISFYGPADMVWGGQIKVNKWVLDTDKIYKNYFGGNYKEVPGKFKESSACEYVSKNAPPTLIIHGTNDPLVSFDHGHRLRKKLNEAGVRNYFLKLPLATHGCDYNINGPYGQLTTRAVENFINSVTWKK